MERARIQAAVSLATERLAKRRAFIYAYALHRHYELKFSRVAQDVFANVRASVDTSLGDLVPTALQQFSAVHDSLRSDNPENWANAVHSCRRILEAVANALAPVSETSGSAQSPDGTKEIKLGKDNYVNRLVAYAEKRSASETYARVVGSNLRFLGDRLDAILDAAHKGTHDNVTELEAHRYVVYTYMLVGDLLVLRSETSRPA